MIRLKGEGPVPIDPSWAGSGPEYVLVLTTEDPRFALDPEPIGLDLAGPAPTLRFDRPGAVLLWKMPPIGP